MSVLTSSFLVQYEGDGRDIDALIEYIGSGLSGELDSSRIAVMGGSCEYSLSSTLGTNANHRPAQTADTWSLWVASTVISHCVLPSNQARPRPHSHIIHPRSNAALPILASETGSRSLRTRLPCVVQTDVLNTGMSQTLSSEPFWNASRL